MPVKVSDYPRQATQAARSGVLHKTQITPAIVTKSMIVAPIKTLPPGRPKPLANKFFLAQLIAISKCSCSTTRSAQCMSESGETPPLTRKWSLLAETNFTLLTRPLRGKLPSQILYSWNRNLSVVCSRWIRFPWACIPAGLAELLYGVLSFDKLRSGYLSSQVSVCYPFWVNSLLTSGGLRCRTESVWIVREPKPQDLSESNTQHI